MKKAKKRKEKNVEYENERTKKIYTRKRRIENIKPELLAISTSRGTNLPPLITFR